MKHRRARFPFVRSVRSQYDRPLMFILHTATGEGARPWKARAARLKDYRRARAWLDRSGVRFPVSEPFAPVGFPAAGSEIF